MLFRSLGISLQGTNTVVCWPRTCAAYVLESSTLRIGNTGAPGAWVPIGITPVVTGNTNCVTVPAQATLQTFRLRLL